MIVKLSDDKRKYSSLVEVSRKDLISKSRRGSKDRYNKRLNYQVTNFRGVDLSQFFNNDYFIYETPINDYVCTLAFPGVLTHLKDVCKTTNGDIKKVNYQLVLRALRRAFDATDDVKVRCTCADFCLSEGTEIKLLDGRDITVEELLEEFNSGKSDLWVYSVDEDSHDFRPGHVSDVWIKGYVNQLIEVELDNGKVVKCTPDHLFMLRDGTYCKAEDLIEGQSLMPLYFQCNKATNEYDTVKFNSKSHGYNSVYKEVAKYELQDEIEEARKRSGEDVIVIHHKNFNKHDNRPENLTPMGRNEHWKYHAEFLAKRRREDKEFDQKCREASRKHCYELNANPTERLIKSRQVLGKKLADSINNDLEKRSYTTQRAQEAQVEYWSGMTPEERSQEVLRRQSLVNNFGEKISKGQKRVWENYSEEERKARNQVNGIILNGEHGEKASERAKDYWNNIRENDPEAYESRCQQSSERVSKIWREDPLKFTKGRCAQVLQKIVDSHMEMTEENYFRLKSKNTPRPTTYWSNFHEMVKELGFGEYNHYVTKITKVSLDNAVPVYDLTVDKYNNFLVSAGVIVHNCYRFMYWANKNGYLYGPMVKGTEQFPEKTNPDDMLGATCKHLDLFLSNKRWLIKAASIVTSLIKAYPEKAEKYLYDPKDLKQTDSIEDEEPIETIPEEEEPIEEPENTEEIESEEEN